MTDSPAVSSREDDRLAELEAVIERGMGTFLEVGRALIEVRDARLYRTGYATFEEYCRHRWGFSRIHAHRLMAAADAVTDMLPTGNTATPASERQARELAAIADPIRRTEVWQQAVERHGPQPTAAAIRSIARPDDSATRLPVEEIDGPPLFPKRPEPRRFAVVDTETGEVVGDAEPMAPIDLDAGRLRATGEGLRTAAQEADETRFRLRRRYLELSNAAGSGLFALDPALVAEVISDDDERLMDVLAGGAAKWFAAVKANRHRGLRMVGGQR